MNTANLRTHSLTRPHLEFNCKQRTALWIALCVGVRPFGWPWITSHCQGWCPNRRSRWRPQCELDWLGVTAYMLRCIALLILSKYVTSLVFGKWIKSDDLLKWIKPWIRVWAFSENVPKKNHHKNFLTVCRNFWAKKILKGQTEKRI